MARCDCCGNDYENAFIVEMNNQRYTFDAFECAIHHLAPTCPTCGCRIMGHGTDKNGQTYCCSHCAE